MRTLMPIFFFLLSTSAQGGPVYHSPVSCAKDQQSFDFTTATVYLDRNQGAYRFTLYGGPAGVREEPGKTIFEVLNGKEPNEYLRRLELGMVDNWLGFRQATFRYSANREGDVAYPMVCQSLPGRRLTIAAKRGHEEGIPAEVIEEIARQSCGGAVKAAGELVTRFRPQWNPDGFYVTSRAFFCE